MKQSAITFGIVITLILLMIGGILVAAKNAKPQADIPEASTYPTLSLPGASSLPLAQTQASSASQKILPKGAIELEASESANKANAKLVKVTLTNQKTFVIVVYEDLAPQTVKNFLTKVSQHFYNGQLIFRTEKDTTGATALIQTGDPTNTGSGGGLMQAEYNKKPFLAGSVGIARGQNRDANSDSQFFVVTVPIESFNQQYTNFGDVVEGLDVVKTIQQGQPIDSIVIVK